MNEILKVIIGFITSLISGNKDLLMSENCSEELIELGNIDKLEKIPIKEPDAPEIFHNNIVRNKYKKGWINKYRDNDSVTEIVIHGTAGGATPEGLLSWMYDGERSSDYYQGISLFHFLIGKKGEIVEVIDPNYYVYHSTSSSHDKTTIGIELINSSKSNRDPYTAEQYIALQNLTFNYLKPRFKNISRITSHRYNILVYNRPATAQKYLKQCPGTGFNWNNLDAMLRENQCTFVTDGNLRYNINEVKE